MIFNNIVHKIKECVDFMEPNIIVSLFRESINYW